MSAGDDAIEKAIIRQAPDAIIFADVTGTIREWNDRATQLFGFTREEALGHGLDVIIPERLRAAHWEGFRAAIAAGRTRSGGRALRTRAVAKGGERLYVEMSFSLVLDERGVVLGAIAIARDATPKHLDGSEPAKP